MWYVHGDGNQTPEELSGKNFGHFYTEDCYIVQWQYRVSFSGQWISVVFQVLFTVTIRYFRCKVSDRC